VATWREHTEHVDVSGHCRQRDDATTERLSEDVDVRNDALEIASEGGPGAAESRLHLVGDHQHLVLNADPAYVGQIASWWEDDARLTLHRLDEHGDCRFVDGVLERRRVAVPDRAKARCIGAVMGLGHVVAEKLTMLIVRP
jgi:hypothetical protein